MTYQPQSEDATLKPVAVSLPELPEPAYKVWIKTGAADVGDYYTTEDVIEYARQAVMAERERCAKACEQVSENLKHTSATAACFDCADAIRGQQP